MPTAHHPLGIDIGGSGIKGAPVNLDKGQLAKDRLRRDTPKLSSPAAVVDIVAQIAAHFEWICTTEFIPLNALYN